MMGVEGGAKAVPEANGANGSAGNQQEHKDSPAVGADAGKQPKLMPTLRCPQLPTGELFMPEAVEAARPAGMDKGEWKARVELAALYRIFYARGWDEEVINHISLRVPGPEHHYLLNPFGLYYGEVTATNLVKVDLDGNLVSPSPYTVNVAGFVIHSAVHGARPDVGCVIHTHSTAGTAVACKQGGLSMDNFYSVMIAQAGVGYHDFEGITVRLGERDRLVKNLGDKAILILRSHGLLVAGSDVAKAFFLYYALQRACEIQCAAGQIPGPNVPIGEDVLQQGTSGAEAADPQGEFYWKMLAGAVRRAKITLQDLVE